MSLELDWSQCEENALGEAFGFYMVFTEIGWVLTEKNIEDFYVRCKLHERFMGTMYYVDGEALHISPSIVHKYIGLKANVAPRTFTQFAMNLVSNERRELKALYTREMRDV